MWADRGGFRLRRLVQQHGIGRNFAASSDPTPTTHADTLVGTPVTGTTWRVTLTTGSGNTAVTRVVEFATPAQASLETIAAGIAVAINLGPF